MSDNIDIPIEASGDDGVNRLTSAIDRLNESMTALGENSAAANLAKQMQEMQSATNTALGALTMQMQEMKQVLATGFADISATNQKLIGAMGASQAKAIQEAGDKAVEATEETNMKILMATERQMDRQIAADNTLNLARQGMLAGAREREIALEVAFDRAQSQVAEQRAASRVLDFDRESKVEAEWVAMLEAATEKKLALESAFDRAQAAMEGQRAAARVLDYERETEIEAKWVAMLEAATEKKLSLESLFDRTQAELAQQRTAARALDLDRESRIEVEWVTMLEAAADKKLALESAFDRAQADMEAQRASERVLDFDRESKIETEWVAMLEAANEKKLALDAAFNRAQAAAETKRETQAEAAANRQRALNAAYLTASPASQVRTAAQASLYSEMGGDAVEKYGAAAAAVDALAAAERRLASALSATKSEAQRQAEELERQRILNTNYLTASPTSQVHIATQARQYAQFGGNAEARYGSAAAEATALAAAQARLTETARAAGVAHDGLSGALKQAEGAFRGAAHEAGIYGLAHGQLIALLAGGAVAAALHHIAETGAEVEYQLKSLNALSGDAAPVDMNKFIGITSGTLTSLKDAAEGVHALAQAGMSQSEAFSVLPDVMRLATLGEMSVGQAAEMAIESMHAFGKEITDLSEIGDILVAVGAKSNVSVHKLAEDMKSAATTGEMFNLDMKEITATVGVLAERGLTIQPLSSALTKLYEPSDKVAKAMKDLNLSTKDLQTGELKNYSQFMGELAEKVNSFKVPADVLKGLGMSSRDAKAVEAMTQDWEKYIDLLSEATSAHGKMFDAMTAKEDTAEGAWKRLGSTVEGSLTKAFEEASPVIRAVEEDLMHMASSDGTVSALANLAAGVARLTQAFVENIGTLVTLVGAYAGLRMISGLTTMVTEFVVAKRAQSVAMAEATVVARAETAQLDLFAVAETEAAAGAARLGAGLEVAATGARLLTSGFGWISIAIVAATAAFDLLAGKMDEADKKHQEQQNTYNSTTDAIQREIDRLKGLEEQLMQTGEAGTLSAARVHIAYAKMREERAKGNLEAAEESTPVDTSLRMAGRHGPTSRNGDQMKQDAVAALRKEVEDAHKMVIDAQNQAAELETLQDHVEVLTQVSNLKKGIGKLPDHVEASGKSAAAKAAAEAANEGLKALRAQEVSEANVVGLAKTYAEVQKEITASKSDYAKSGATGDKDSAHVRIEQRQEELRLMQEASKVRVDDLKSQNRRGELGDLQLINKELAEKQALDRKALDMAIAEKAAAGPLKPGQQERYNSRINSAAARLGPNGLDAQAAERQRLDVLDKMDTEELQARARALTSKGQLEQAYLVSWEAKYGATLANLNSDIAAAEGTQYEERLQRFKAFLEDQRRLGANDARFREAKGDFGASSAELNQRLNYLKLQNGPGTGLGSQLINLVDQHSTYADMLPQMQAAQNRVQSLSSVMYSGPDAKEKLKEAKNELAEIQSQMAAMRNTAVTMGEAIAKALTDAYGKGGAALGGMITTATAYGTKMAEIQATLASSGNTEADKQKVAEATASAQIKSYGDMAGAAKGFFDQNSNGYKIMAAAEKAFRVMEIVEAGAALAKKLGFKTAEVTGTVAADGIKTASGTAATGVDVANAAASSSAWGITAVVKAIASMTFPMNLVAGAATLAAVVSVGAKIAGAFGGSDTTAQDRQATNGTGTIAGDPTAKTDSIAKSLSLVEKNTYDDLSVSQSMLTALQSIETNISNFAGLLMQSVGYSAAGSNISLSSGIGASIPLVGHLLSSIFGGKQTLTDTGFTMDAASYGQIASQGVSARTYADVTTSGGWFSGDSHDTKTTNLTAQANQQITSVITGIGGAVKQAAGLLGLAGSQFDQQLNGFVIDIGKISLKGLSSADQQAAINAAFSKVGDQMAAAAVSSISQFSQAGEGALQTLVRVAAEVQTVQTVFSSFGATFTQTGTSAIQAADAFVQAAGGLDKFTSQADYLFKNFLTQGQQTAATLARISPTLNQYGLTTVGANANQRFADLVTTFADMGAAGATAYTALMNIAPAFKSITDIATNLQSELNATLSQVQQDAIARAALDPANQGLFDQVQQAKAVSAAKASLVTAYQNESQSMQAAIDKLKSFSLSLHSFVNTLQLGNLSPLNPADKYGAALAQFNDTLAKARGGDATAQGNLQSVAQAFLTASRDANASNSTYQADYQRVVSSTDSMASWADGQVSLEQSQLNALHDQVAALVDIRTATMSVADAINNLAIVMTAGKDTSTNNTTIESLYQELLGRTPDAAGEAFWTQQLNNGVSLSDIIDGFKHSAEYATYTNTTPATSTVTPSTSYGTASLPATPVVAAPSSQLQIDTLYEQLFNHPADQAGEAFWVDKLNSGVSLSAISDAMKQSTEYQSLHAQPATVTAPSTDVTQPAPSTDTTSTPSADPYQAIVASNAQIIAQQAITNAQLAALRTEQQTQADQQVDATMNAGADTADQVASAITESTQAAAWNANNTVTLR